MHKHWQLSQCACAGNHISAAGQGHWVGLTDSLINQGHHRLPRYMSQSASSSSLASTVSPSLRPVQHQNMQNMGQRRSRFSFWHWQPVQPHTMIPAYIAAHFLWRTNIAGTYNPFNWHLQLSNCRTLGRASWFIHNNWSTPCLTTRPLLLRAWHIGFKDQNSATPPSLPPLQQ